MTIYDFIEKEFGPLDGCNIVEVGAHIGSDTEQLYKFVKNGTLMVYEPDPRDIPALKSCIKTILDGGTNIILLEKAIGAEEGEASFYLSSGSREDGGEDHTASSSLKKPKGHYSKFPWVKFSDEVKVEVTTLDDSCPLAEIDLLWVDVQGAELDLIRGAQKKLLNTKFLFTEFNDAEIYEGQVGLEKIMNALPGEWGVVKIFGDEVLLQNKAFGTGWVMPGLDKFSIVMQGEVLDHTRKALAALRTHFPQAEIILSTWSHEDTSNLDVDVLIKTPDPGGGREIDYKFARGNMKRLFLGCAMGIASASYNSILKIRSDTVFTGNGFLSHIWKWPKRCPQKMKVFDDKIIVPNVGTADPEVHICFQVTDWVMFGSKYDMTSLFNVPIEDVYDTEKSPEQYLWLNSIRRKYPDIDIDNINDKPPEAVSATIDFMSNNLIVLDTSAQFNFYSGKYPTYPDDYPLNVRHAKWASWYGAML